jgi:hypothetical protein
VLWQQAMDGMHRKDASRLPHGSGATSMKCFSLASSSIGRRFILCAAVTCRSIQQTQDLPRGASTLQVQIGL